MTAFTRLNFSNYKMKINTPTSIARTWKQPRCPSADEWVRKLWYIYTMEYYSAIKNNNNNNTICSNMDGPRDYHPD